MSRKINYITGLCSGIFFGAMSYASNQNLIWAGISILFGFIIGVVFADIGEE